LVHAWCRVSLLFWRLATVTVGVVWHKGEKKNKKKVVAARTKRILTTQTHTL
jgi:hypothetical protein